MNILKENKYPPTDFNPPSHEELLRYTLSQVAVPVSLLVSIEPLQISLARQHYQEFIERIKRTL